jgi:hypothetical protein
MMIFLWHKMRNTEFQVGAWGITYTCYYVVFLKNSQACEYLAGSYCCFANTLIRPCMGPHPIDVFQILVEQDVSPSNQPRWLECNIYLSHFVVHSTAPMRSLLSFAVLLWMRRGACCWSHYLVEEGNLSQSIADG